MLERSPLSVHPFLTNRKNMLREMMQRRMKNDPNLKQRKRLLAGQCPGCGTQCPSLHATHVGKYASDVIDAVVYAHPAEHRIGRLDNLVQSALGTMHVDVCCSRCNRVCPDCRNGMSGSMTTSKSTQASNEDGDVCDGEWCLLENTVVAPQPPPNMAEDEWRQRWHSEGLLATRQLVDVDALD